MFNTLTDAVADVGFEKGGFKVKIKREQRPAMLVALPRGVCPPRKL